MSKTIRVVRTSGATRRHPRLPKSSGTVMVHNDIVCDYAAWMDLFSQLGRLMEELMARLIECNESITYKVMGVCYSAYPIF